MKKRLSLLLYALCLGASDEIQKDYADLAQSIKRTESENVTKSQNLRQHIELGYIGSSGNSDTQTVHALYGNDYLWSDRTDLHFRADALYVSSGGDTTDERYRAYGIGNHIIDRQWYSYLELGFLRDPYAGYDAQYNAGLGMGYKIYDTKTKTLKIRAGYQYRYADMTDEAEEHSHFFKTGLNAVYRFSEKNSLQSEINLLENLKKSADYETVFRIALKSYIIDRFSLKIGFELQYDNTPPLNEDGTEKEKTDTTTTIGVAYDF